MTEERSIELEIEVAGTAEEVWQAIATGPGISSWYVPHQIEEHEDGAAVASFGPEPEMQAPGRVAAWEPPHRFMIDGGPDSTGMAFEWLIEARDGGTCIVRLVNSGFGNGDEWDSQYDCMREGWQIFLGHLRLHLEHFAGRSATAALPMAMWAGPRADAWTRLTGDLSIDPTPAIGDRIDIAADGDASLSGTVAATTAHHISILVDTPVPGTAFLAAESAGEHISVSVWSYLYGADGAASQRRDEPIWRTWLSERGIPDESR